MKIKDFKLTKKVKQDSLKKTTHSFCELCFKANPNTEDGYTTCCNELSIDKDEAIKQAKSQDVFDYLANKFSVSSHGNSYLRTFELSNKKVKFNVNLNNKEEDIIKIVLDNTKGLRKEK